MKIKLQTFSGMQPKVSPHLLNEQFAQVCQNVNTASGALTPWHSQVEKYNFEDAGDYGGTYDVGERCVWNGNLWVCKVAITSTELFNEDHWTLMTIRSVYELTQNGESNWVPSEYVGRVLESPLSNDSYERLYISEGGTLKYWVNNYRSVGGTISPTRDPRFLGVPAPTSSAMSFVSGHTGGSDYRAYIYTYVNEFGEEGPPAVDSAGEIDILETTTYLSGNVVITGFVEPPANYCIADRHGTGLEGALRLYRTNSDSNGVAMFQFVTEVALPDYTNFSTLQVTDSVASVDLGEVIPSLNWQPPVDGLESLVALPNGCFAAFKDNTVYFSEPYMPHAWPYSTSIPEKIVSLGVFGSTVVALTEGFPYLLSGTDPEFMSKQKVGTFHPCVSAAGVVSAENSVIFPSKEGLCRLSQDGLDVITEPLATADQWSEYVPDSLNGTWYEGKYFGFYKDSNDNLAGFMLDFHNASFTNLSMVQNLYCAAVSQTTGDLFFVMDDITQVDLADPDATLPKKIYQWDADHVNFMYYTWKSKEFVLPANTNMAVARVMLDLLSFSSTLDLITNNEYLISQNEDLITAGTTGGTLGDATFNSQDVNGDDLNDVSSISMSGAVTFTLYVDGVVKFTKVVSTDKPFKMPSGYKGRRVEVSLAGYIPVYEVVLAQSMGELKNG